eukprot:TRINITY_DN54678_c0_g1_i1.p1 TRINITY_DN54678_c0_g1~~TRINITY_DN54678_c0_g1_i1.p1  ORF type:complete len:597 (-),score=102.50 TRINITY_DN54678_c0_g1_i1:253-2043(-)
MAPSGEENSIDAPSPWHLPHACGPRWVKPGICEFRVWAPHGEDVAIEFEGTENGDARSVPLQREGDFWRGEATAAPGQRYRVALNSSWNDCFHEEGARLFRRDPCARACDFDSTWCILHAPIQTPKPFAAPKFNELTIYELHLGTWVQADDEPRAFAAAAEKLEYIQSLGFNCIQLMPTTEFGGMWGYNSRQLLASHGRWGSSTDLKELVEKAHSLGIAVLFDVVLNHGSAKMNVLWNWDGYGPDKCGGIYFEGEKDTPWGRRFAFHKAEIQDYLKQTCRTWIEEYGVDGLRFDSVHNMPWWLLQQLTHGIKEHYPDKILIAEITPETPAVINDAGFHSCWLHAPHFDSVKMMKKCDGGGDPNNRINMLKHMVAPRGYSSLGGVNSILGSHDQVGDRHDGRDDNGSHRYYVSRLGGKANWHARAQCRAWFAFQNCCRGLPMTFMGTESLQEGWWHCDHHHRFNWGVAEGDDAQTLEMKKLVAASNGLRLSQAALTAGDVKFVHEDAGGGVLGFMRWTDGGAPCLCIVHMGEQQWENNSYGINTGWGGGRSWRLALNTQAAEFGGWEGSATAEASADGDGKIHISIPKWCALVYMSA